MKRSSLVSLFSALAAISLAQPSQPEVKVEISHPQSIVAGTKFKIFVKVTFPEGWHAYAPLAPGQKPAEDDYKIRMTLSTSASEKVFAKFVSTFPKPKIDAEGVEIYEGMIEIPVEITPGKNLKSIATEIIVGYQVCSGSTCLPPRKMKVPLKIKIEPNKPAPKKKGSGKP